MSGENQIVDARHLYLKYASKHSHLNKSREPDYPAEKENESILHS